MSVAYYIVLDRDDLSFDPFVNGKCIAQNSDNINRLCRKQQLKELDEYTSIAPDEMADWIEDEFGDDFSFEPEEEKWFPAREGLVFAKTLKKQVEKNPQSVDDPQGVVSDLTEFIDILTRAEAAGARFHFRIDF